MAPIRFRAKLSSNFTELASGIIRSRMYFLAGGWFSQRIWGEIKGVTNDTRTSSEVDKGIGEDSHRTGGHRE